MSAQDNRCSVPFDGKSRILLHKNTVSACCKTPQYPIDPVTGVITKEIIELRTSIINNVRSPQCAGCWYDDDLGAPSYRRRHSTHFSKTIEWENIDVNQPVQDIEVLFSNKCQMMCVYCSSDISSMWEDYERKSGLRIEVKPESSRLEDILDVDSLQQILLSGGEPLLEPECIRFIMALPYKESRKISIVTNLSYGTAVFETLTNIIDRHKNVFVVCSLDSMNENVNRKYLNLELWKRNFEKLVRYTSAGILINITVTILSYKEVAEVIEYVIGLRKQGFNLSFNINTIQNDHLTSLASGRLDPEYTLQLRQDSYKYLRANERRLIDSFNDALRNTEYNEVLANRTAEHLEKYLE